ncbi:hypothetical protein BOV90_03995 [Solemya velum gill symbiont]|uniref:DUF924 domain-containing protein n=3 Tax=Solemya velum gill symbiont TaxID=2340 RepID=A0A1T2CUF5_SOVGS|nr:DUF924 family protein [Solemya velum gill symbiont]OOY35530.1 hypothetical protein BOV88_04625 [Solemya velum gill symbiont]OOY38515.1 hypothetical protein BOV89_01550 [Solemya velum gill symbiont]OOY40469.1 hypothetical protein BOV90_03995 [Solemya velum gill symbiont]OOY45846.1 hypothetical protein BOV92_04315 [Solemya velum gill symbiont]OOY48895.1 hypothetical protein BOV93_00195 [Solemya velum gill symbiont]
MTPSDIIDYWYSDRIKKTWFSSIPELDLEIKARYEKTWHLAKNDALDSWRESAEGCLALVIILDQFPLNMFRGDPRSFETESKAIEISKLAINKGFDKELTQEALPFLIMPLMHSENIQDQELSVRLFKQHNLADNLRFAEHHRDLIRKFGRFPHRNKTLGRESTEEEKQYLQSKNAFTG